MRWHGFVVMVLSIALTQFPKEIGEMTGFSKLFPRRTGNETMNLSPMWDSWNANNVNFRVQDAPVASWKQAPNFAERLFYHRKPAKLTDTPADEWRAVKDPSLWSPENIVKQKAMLKGVHVHAQGDTSFMYFSEEKMNNYTAKYASLSKKYNMSSEEFLYLLRKKGPGEDEENARKKAQSEWLNVPPGSEVYYSSCLCTPSWKETELVKTSLGSYEDFLGSYLRNRRPLPKEKPNFYVWMGGQGVSVSPHYDAVHNIFVQLHGRKRFILFAPTANRALYSYSRLHPNARQSQVNFSSVSESKDLHFFFSGGMTKSEESISAGSSNLDAIDVVLEPGDVLYIPPYWYHYVIAEDVSVSVSLWFDAEELDWMNEVGSIAVPKVPTRENASEEDKANMDLVGHAHFIMQTLTRFSNALEVTSGWRQWKQTGKIPGINGPVASKYFLYPPRSGIDLLIELVEQRYYVIEKAMLQALKPTLEKKNLPISLPVLKVPACRLPEGVGKPLDDHLTTIDKYAKLISMVLIRVPNKDKTTHPLMLAHNHLTDMTNAYNRAIAETQMLNYVEEYLASAIGVHQMVPFLRALVEEGFCDSVWSEK